jgi:hypothetical protein
VDVQLYGPGLGKGAMYAFHAWNAAAATSAGGGGCSTSPELDTGHLVQIIMPIQQRCCCCCYVFVNNIHPCNAVGRTREESHAICTDIDESAEVVVDVPAARGDLIVHHERTLHCR